MSGSILKRIFMDKKTKAGFIKLCQFIYLTVSYYFQNNLDASASACTFGFIFSFIPILMMILTIFIGILHASPSIIDLISNTVSKYTDVFNIDKIIHNIGSGISFSWVNFILAVFIVWMARKLFLSIIQGLTRIFKTAAPPRPVIKQLLTFAGELLIIIICTIVFLSAFITRQIFSLPIFSSVAERLPILFSSLSNTVVNLALYFILFIFTSAAYKFATGTKPQTKVCVICSGLCTLSFYISILILSIFLNKAKYNTIYGVLSNFIILLLEVYIFFSLFMFFAQGIYTVQFMHPMLLSELYLLPHHDENLSIKDSARRLLFITPSAIMSRENTFFYKCGDSIYTEKDRAECVYYVADGSICEERNSTKTVYAKGAFFGEFEYLLDIPRQGQATAVTNCTILRISDEEFSELMEKTPEAAAKAMSKLSLHFKSLNI